MKLIPFKWTPAAWGLSGEAYEIAEVCYNYPPGYDQEIKVAHIKYRHDSEAEELAILEIDRKYKKRTDFATELEKLACLEKYDRIDLYQHAVKSLQTHFRYNLISNEVFEYDLLKLDRKFDKVSETEYQLQFLDLEKEYGKITETEHEKLTATAMNEPWVKILSFNFDKNEPGAGSIELDWNTRFVEHLRSHGYEGKTEEEIVDDWLGELCKNVAAQHFAGVGHFDEVMGIDSIGNDVSQHAFIKSSISGNTRIVK